MGDEDWSKKHPEKLRKELCQEQVQEEIWGEEWCPRCLRAELEQDFSLLAGANFAGHCNSKSGCDPFSLLFVLSTGRFALLLGQATNHRQQTDECLCNILIVGKELGGVMSKAKEVINQADDNHCGYPQQDVCSAESTFFSQCKSLHLEPHRFREAWLPS